MGVGSAGVDYLASIASFPEPDAKLRTDALEIQGGGNAGNALTAMSRLGVKPSILTKLSDDGAGKAILDEFAADGVDASAVVIEAGKSSPFTYIIVDRAGSTRTCIHTPGKKGTSLHPTPRIHALAVPNHQSTSDRIVPLTKYATPDQPPNTPPHFSDPSFPVAERVDPHPGSGVHPGGDAPRRHRLLARGRLSAVL